MSGDKREAASPLASRRGGASSKPATVGPVKGSVAALGAAARNTRLVADKAAAATQTMIPRNVITAPETPRRVRLFKPRKEPIETRTQPVVEVGRNEHAFDFADDLAPWDE